MIVSSPAWPDCFEGWSGGSGSGYERLKSTIAGILVENLERLYPGTRDRILFVDTATPLTMERSAGNSGGSFSG